jgi:hypothetical protein
MKTKLRMIYLYQYEAAIKKMRAAMAMGRATV